MPITRSKQLNSRILLLVSSGLLFSLIAWIGFRVFQPTEVPPLMPSKSPISFNADQEIEKDSLFKKLQLFVRGGYTIGEVGNSFPLGGNPKKKTPKGYDNKALLATAAEVQLNGILVRDVTLNKEGGVLMLLQSVTSDSQIHYEIRTMGLKEDRSIAQWNALPRPDLRVAGFTQDATGQIWLLNEKGQVGMISSGAPSWMTSLSTGLSVLDPKGLAISSDSLDRVWLMDGNNVSMGGEKGFTPIDLISELTADQQTQYQSIIASQVQQIGFQSLDGPAAYLRAALAPKAFYPLSDGRMGLVTAYGAIIFPQSQSARVTWIPTLQFSVVPYGISNDGSVWGSHHTDHALVRIIDEHEQSFAPGPAPSTESFHIGSMTFLEDEAFVLEQANKLTNLWYSNGDAWSTKLVSTTGTQATIAAPNKLKAEEDGTLWSLMSDGYLYRITSGASVESPTTGTNI